MACLKFSLNILQLEILLDNIKKVNKPSEQVYKPSKQVNIPFKQVNTPSKQINTPSIQVNIPSKLDRDSFRNTTQHLTAARELSIKIWSTGWNNLQLEETV